MNTRLTLEFLLLGALWGASFLFMRLGAADFGPWATAGLRVGLAALVLLPLLWASGHARALGHKAGPILLVGLLNSGLPFALFAYAVMHISTGLASILNATVPLFGAAVAWAWLKDRPVASRQLGLAIGFVGVVVLSWGKTSFAPGGTGWAVLACLAATLCYALAASFTKRYLMGVPPLATATGSQIGAMLGLALPTVWFWPSTTPGLSAWLAIAALALLCTALAYILYFRLIERAGPAKALTVTYLIPLFALIYGVIFLGESITAWMVGCGLLILLGIALATGQLRLGRGA
jgi:drug/metabolite transporter (DMT)-like permease